MAGGEKKKSGGGEIVSLRWIYGNCVFLDLMACLAFSGGKKKEVKKETGLGISYKKDDNFGEWYSEVYFFFLLHRNGILKIFLPFLYLVIIELLVFGSLFQSQVRKSVLF